MPGLTAPKHLRPPRASTEPGLKTHRFPTPDHGTRTLLFHQVTDGRYNRQFNSGHDLHLAVVRCPVAKKLAEPAQRQWSR